MSGFIYLLRHDRMPGLVKIGFTTTTVEQRLTEISDGTGVPGKFTVFHSFPVSSPQATEAIVHAKLHAYRHVSSKEFFELKPEVARDYVEKIIANAECGVTFDEQEMSLVRDCASLGEIIKAQRKHQRMTQGDLAAKSGTGIRFIVEIEQGKPSAQIGKVLEVMSVLGIRIAVDRVKSHGVPEDVDEPEYPAEPRDAADSR